MNPYQVLGVSQTDDEDIIKKAYRKAAKECHPDTHPGDKRAEERFKEIGEAYRILSDKQKRKEYDARAAQREQESATGRNSAQTGRRSAGGSIYPGDIEKEFERFFSKGVQSRGRDTFTAICGIVFLAFLLLAVMDSLPTKRKRGANGRGIQELLLLDEEGNEISAWHIGGKTSLLIGRDEHKENVDINLQNTEYGGMVDRQHAVLNYAAGQWYIEDLGSRNGVRIQDAKDGKLYQVSKEHPCRINAGDIIFIGNTRLRAK